MAKQSPVVAYFRARGNDKAPLFEARFDFDAEQMRKHQEYFECDANGNALDGKSEALPKFVRNAPEELTTETDGGGTVTVNKKPIKRRG